MDELIAAIQAGRLEPMYVLHSEHPILIERVLTTIRDVVVPPAARGFNYDIVEGKPTGARIVALAQTLPMMAQRRMVYVREKVLVFVVEETSDPPPVNQGHAAWCPSGGGPEFSE